MSDAGDASEREAHAAADHAVSSNEIRIGAAPSALVQRDGNDVGIGLGIAGAVVGGALIGLAIAGIAGAFDKKKPEDLQTLLSTMPIFGRSGKRVWKKA